MFKKSWNVPAHVSIFWRLCGPLYLRVCLVNQNYRVTLYAMVRFFRWTWPYLQRHWEVCVSSRYLLQYQHSVRLLRSNQTKYAGIECVGGTFESIFDSCFLKLVLDVRGQRLVHAFCSYLLLRILCQVLRTWYGEMLCYYVSMYIHKIYLRTL